MFLIKYDQLFIQSVHVGYKNIQIRWKIYDLTNFRTRKIKLNGNFFIQIDSTGSSDYFKQFWGVVPWA